MKVIVAGIVLFLIGMVHTSSNELYTRHLLEQKRYLEALETNSTASLYIPQAEIPSATKDPPESTEVNDDNLIHVHFISHSHDDVGWLKHPVDYFQDQV